MFSETFRLEHFYLYAILRNSEQCTYVHQVHSLLDHTIVNYFSDLLQTCLKVSLKAVLSQMFEYFYEQFDEFGMQLILHLLLLTWFNYFFFRNLHARVPVPPIFLILQPVTQEIVSCIGQRSLQPAKSQKKCVNL